MITATQLRRLRNAPVDVVCSDGIHKGEHPGEIRIISHVAPVKGTSMNLEVFLKARRAVTLQLHKEEMLSLAMTPDRTRLSFLWDGIPRVFRPVIHTDLVDFEV